MLIAFQFVRPFIYSHRTYRHTCTLFSLGIDGVDLVTHLEHACCQPPASADNVTLLAFAVDRRAAERPATTAIDRYIGLNKTGFSFSFM